MWWFRRRVLPLGPRGEEAAARFLRRAGFRILARNVRLGRNELDIVARDGETTVFVEVRTRAAADAVPPEDTIGPAKQAQLQKAARAWMARHGREHYYRFDVVAVLYEPGRRPEITHIPDAFPGA